MIKKVILIVLIVAVGGFLLIQFVPFGRDHTNPPVVQEPKWDSPATRELAKRACFDCHSNETVWPWYSNIAPALVAGRPRYLRSPRLSELLRLGARRY